MRILLQRVVSASCEVNNTVVGRIDRGLLLMVAFSKQDDASLIDRMAHRMAHARVFEDDAGKMNLDVQAVGGSILSISQFTLYGNTHKGHRPSFDQAASAVAAARLYQRFNDALAKYVNVETGEFQADMKILAHLDGPVTLNYQEDNA
jgi:D-tyrosyl-tRNA(Tyr) deacylase